MFWLFSASGKRSCNDHRHSGTLFPHTLFQGAVALNTRFCGFKNILKHVCYTQTTVCMHNVSGFSSQCGVCDGQLGDATAGTDVRIRNGLLSCHECYIASRGENTHRNTHRNTATQTLTLTTFIHSLTEKMSKCHLDLKPH